MPAATNHKTTTEEWTTVTVDATNKVINEALLAEFFADPTGTFHSLMEWPARILVVKTDALPDLDGDDVRLAGIRRSDVISDHLHNAAALAEAELAHQEGPTS